MYLNKLRLPSLLVLCDKVVRSHFYKVQCAFIRNSTCTAIVKAINFPLNLNMESQIKFTSGLRKSLPARPIINSVIVFQSTD